jgi:hypothetical protein
MPIPFGPVHQSDVTMSQPRNQINATIAEFVLFISDGGVLSTP